MPTLAFALLSGHVLREQHYKAPRSRHVANRGEALPPVESAESWTPRHESGRPHWLWTDSGYCIKPATLTSSRATLSLCVEPASLPRPRAGLYRYELPVQKARPRCGTSSYWYCTAPIIVFTAYDSTVYTCTPVRHCRHYSCTGKYMYTLQAGQPRCTSVHRSEMLTIRVRQSAIIQRYRTLGTS